MRRGLGIVICAAAAIGASGSAQAAEQLGSTGSAGACDQGHTWVQGDSVTGPDYRASAPGVVTSWSTLANTDLNTYQFMILRPDSGTAPPYSYTPMEQDIVRVLTTPEAVNTFSGLHLPIKTGETIGLYVPTPQPNAIGRCASVAGAGDSVQKFLGVPPLGTSSNFQAPLVNIKMNLTATIEPDADGDRFGDETQDGCPAQAAVQTACPLPAAPAPLKKCKKKKKAKRATGYAKKKSGCKKRKKKRK